LPEIGGQTGFWYYLDVARESCNQSECVLQKHVLGRKNVSIKWTRIGQTMIYKVAHRKLKIEQNEPYKEPGVNSGVSEGQVTHAPRLAPVMLLLLQNLLLSNEGEKDWIVFTTNRTFYWSFVIHIFRSG
jgi:hypothetical protein